MSDWNDVLIELHDRFDALEKEIRKASTGMSAIIREYVDRPQGEWVSEGRIYPPTNGYHGAVCSICGTESEYLTNFCGECGADMRKGEPQTECDNDCPYRVDGLGCMRLGGCYKESE